MNFNNNVRKFFKRNHLINGFQEVMTDTPNPNTKKSLKKQKLTKLDMVYKVFSITRTLCNACIAM